MKISAETCSDTIYKAMPQKNKYQTKATKTIKTTLWYEVNKNFN
jgi:hypothetical protein